MTEVSMVATDEIREVALAWLGVDPWQTSLWEVSDWGHADGESWADTLPLHLPAGRDLAVRVLAARWVDDDGKRQYSGVEVAILICAALDGAKEALLALPEPWREVVAHVPYPGPSEVRIALALRGCLEIDSHGHDLCH